MKKIITHVNPDLDAVCAVWLLKRFLLGWQEAEIDFVLADDKQIEKENKDLVYVDVGLGRLDHHQTGEYLSASKLCWDFLKKARKGESFKNLESQAIERLVEVVTQVDNARYLSWSEAKDDRHQFYLHNLIDGWRELPLNDIEIIEEGFKMLDTVLLNLKNKINVEEELKKATTFKTKWGKGIASETGNKHFLYLPKTLGYQVMLIKNPKSGGIRVHGQPDSKVDLSAVYHQVKKLDPDSDWFLHASKKMLLNMASVAKMRPTKLSLKKIIEVLQDKNLPSAEPCLSGKNLPSAEPCFSKTRND